MLMYLSVSSKRVRFSVDLDEESDQNDSNEHQLEQQQYFNLGDQHPSYIPNQTVEQVQQSYQYHEYIPDQQQEEQKMLSMPEQESLLFSENFESAHFPATMDEAPHPNTHFHHHQQQFNEYLFNDQFLTGNSLIPDPEEQHYNHHHAFVENYQTQYDFQQSTAHAKAILPGYYNDNTCGDSQILQDFGDNTENSITSILERIEYERGVNTPVDSDLNSTVRPSPVMVQTNRSNQCIGTPRSCHSTQTETSQEENQRQGLITPVLFPWD